MLLTTLLLKHVLYFLCFSNIIIISIWCQINSMLTISQWFQLSPCFQWWQFCSVWANYHSNKEVTHFTDRSNETQRHCLWRKSLRPFHTLWSLSITISLLIFLAHFPCHPQQLKFLSSIKSAENVISPMKCSVNYSSRKNYSFLGTLFQPLVEQVLYCIVFSCTWFYIYFIGNSMTASRISLYLHPKCLTQSQKLNNYSFLKLCPDSTFPPVAEDA